MPKHNKILGSEGEALAAHFLVSKGFIIIQRNFRTRYGEIDIIARKDQTLYFVEVKTRSNINYGYPSEAINFKKLQKMRLMGEIYINTSKYTGQTNLALIEVLNGDCRLIEI